MSHEECNTESQWELPTLSEEGPAAHMGNTNGFSLPGGLAVAVDPAMPVASRSVLDARELTERLSSTLSSVKYLTHQLRQYVFVE